MYVIGLIETQFIAYLQLIRCRLQMLNNVLIHFKENIKTHKHHSANGKIPTDNHSASINFKMLEKNMDSLQHLDELKNDGKNNASLNVDNVSLSNKGVSLYTRTLHFFTHNTKTQKQKTI